MIKWLFKAMFSITRRLAAICDYDLNITRTGTADVFDYCVIDNFWPNGELMKLYEASIQHVGGKKTDNIYKRMRLHTMAYFLEIAIQKNKDLDAAECGCWNGHSTHMGATLMKKIGFEGTFSVFDSFEGGLSEFTKEDLKEGNTSGVKEANLRTYFESSFEEVSDRLSAFDFVKLYKGWIPDRFDEVADRKFSFVTIDVDMYEPTLDSLKFFYPRLVEGGIIFMDDYNAVGFPGANQAINEYVKEHPPSYFICMPYGSAIIIK